MPRHHRTETGAEGHLGIALGEYDARIRTLVPHYEDMLDAAAAVVAGVRTPAPRIVDLGIGTGALSARCLELKPRARVTGIDQDVAILAAARDRIGPRLATTVGNFVTTPLPAADAFIASLALHHVPTLQAKRRLYHRIASRLRSGGIVVSADCFLSSSRVLQKADRAAWLAHLQALYTRAESRRFLRTWAREDVYMTLDDELDALKRAGLAADVAWRRGSFGVIVGSR